MFMFKREIVFKQFIPAMQKFKEIDLPDDFPVTDGIVRVYQTDWDDIDALRYANELDLCLVEENEKATSYTKTDRNYDVAMIRNKNDKSVMIAISRIRKHKDKRRKRR